MIPFFGMLQRNSQTRSPSPEAARPFLWAPEGDRRRTLSQRIGHSLRRIVGRQRGRHAKPETKVQIASPRLGPKRRALLEQHGLNGLKRAAGYLLGLFILGFSLLQAARLLSENGTETGMVNVLLGIFTGIVVLFLTSHDTAVARRQGH